MILFSIKLQDQPQFAHHSIPKAQHSVWTIIDSKFIHSSIHSLIHSLILCLVFKHSFNLDTICSYTSANVNE